LPIDFAGEFWHSVSILRLGDSMPASEEGRRMDASFDFEGKPASSQIFSASGHGLRPQAFPHPNFFTIFAFISSLELIRVHPRSKKFGVSSSEIGVKGDRALFLAKHI
jgi:hypothetical protein